MTNSVSLILLPALLALVGLLAIPLLLNWDKATRSFVLAVRGLWLHKLRAFLSVLGIIIGTSAVIALMAFGEGSMHDALEDIKRRVPMRVFPVEVRYLERMVHGRVVATTPAYTDVHEIDLSAGRFITAED